jgi:alkylated DNA repair dioxygenase AlkB
VVQRLLQDLEWQRWGDREIARRTGTSHVFVSKVRHELAQDAALSGNGYQIVSPTRTVQRGKSIYPMDTAKIGQAASASTLVDGEWMEPVVTKGLDKLQNAWRAASPPARRAFRDWVATQPLEDLAFVAASEKTKRYNAVIADVCSPIALLAAPAPEGFVYIPDFLSPEEHDDLLCQLRALTYEHDVFRGQTMKRGWAQFGWGYVSIGQQLEPAPPIPPYLQAVIDKAAPYYQNSIEFAQCIVTKYPVGAGIGFHKDAPCFGDCILGVSLAAEARLRFRPKGETHPSFAVTASPGSLYVMEGTARWQYEHQIMPVKKERYSLTFRTVGEDPTKEVYNHE